METITLSGTNSGVDLSGWPAHNELLTSTDEGLFELVHAFFLRSLQQLFHIHSSPMLRLEVNEWIFGPKLVSPWQESDAFSFQFCCRLLALDAVQMREDIHGYLVQTGIVDLIDRREMGVSSKVSSRPSVKIVTDGLPEWVQLMIFAEDDADFLPPPIARRKRRLPQQVTDASHESCEQISLFDSLAAHCA